MKKDNVKKIPEIKKIIRPVLVETGIKKAGIFGSYARGEATAKSDIDILIEFKGSLLKLAHLNNQLEELLRKKVDLITYKGIHPYLKKRILSEEIRIL